MPTPGIYPCKKALYEALRKSKKPAGGQKLTLLKLIEKQLKSQNLGVEEAIQLAQDRFAWRQLVFVI